MGVGRRPLDRRRGPGPWWRCGAANLDDGRDAGVPRWCCIHNMATYVAKDFLGDLVEFDDSFKISGDFEYFSRALLRQPFARIGSAIAGYRRTGENASVVQADLMRGEIDRVRAAYAPRNVAVRLSYNLLMKSWLNARNPGWTLSKWPATRDGLTASALRHFF